MFYFALNRGFPSLKKHRPSGKFKRCGRFGGLDFTDRSVCHGRYRLSVRFHLWRITVDIDGRFDP